MDGVVLTGVRSRAIPVCEGGLTQKAQYQLLNYYLGTYNTFNSFKESKCKRKYVYTHRRNYPVSSNGLSKPSERLG